MGERTAIEWTDATWNPWRGCTKVSPGCASCYMFRDQVRYGRDPAVVVRAAPATFNAPLRWQRVLDHSGERGLVFTCSWSDWFHEAADPWRAEAWSIIRRTPHLTYQILTKRPERIAEHLPADWGLTGYPNVWLGVSVENQHWADRRIPILIGIPARLRFLSCEPLLKPLELRHWFAFAADCFCPDSYIENGIAIESCPRHNAEPSAAISWVICGGESGGRPGHPPRPMALDWVRSLRDQCVESNVPFFLKQLGGARPGGTALLDGREWRQMPA